MIRLFRWEDISAALQLCRSAGWNQLESDWSRLVNYEPQGCFVAEVDGRLVGTVTATRYGSQLAWIGMMLVHPDFRRRGIGMTLMQASLAYLRHRGVQCVKLDATPAGEPVYQRLGFQPEWSFHRWQIEKSQSAMPGHGNRSKGIRLDRHADLDLRAFGVDRADWLQRLSEGSACVDHDSGFGMLRTGFLASYLGPVTASGIDSASWIIERLLSLAGEKVFWDVPQPNRWAVDLAARKGFTPVRDLTRMRLGPPPDVDLDLQYAICDPGTG